MEEGTAPVASEPPPLPYSLRHRKKSIAIFWIIFVVDTLGQPVALYWALWYATNLSHNVGMLRPLFSLMFNCLWLTCLALRSSVLYCDRVVGRCLGV